MIDVSMGMVATKQLKKLFDGENLFSHPKGVDLVKLLVQQATSDEDIILDFFAGSGTTAHAVASQNSCDGGNRRFILVQLAEEFDSSARAYDLGYTNVAELSRERIRRVLNVIAEESEHEAAGKGFRTLVVDTTNMADVLRNPDETDQLMLDLLEGSVKAGRSSEDLLFQVMLDWGLELTMPIGVEVIEGHEVFIVEDGVLVACFDERVSPSVIHLMAELRPERAVFRDSGFGSDDARINAEQVFREVSSATDVKAI